MLTFFLTQPKEAEYLLSTASLHLNYLNTSGSIVRMRKGFLIRRVVFVLLGVI
jgi:hypothetical protein